MVNDPDIYRAAKLLIDQHAEALSLAFSVPRH